MVLLIEILTPCVRTRLFYQLNHTASNHYDTNLLSLLVRHHSCRRKDHNSYLNGALFLSVLEQYTRAIYLITLQLYIRAYV